MIFEEDNDIIIFILVKHAFDSHVENVLKNARGRGLSSRYNINLTKNNNLKYKNDNENKSKSTRKIMKRKEREYCMLEYMRHIIKRKDDSGMINMSSACYMWLLLR